MRFKKKKQKLDELDDGRTISDMNVPGFDWYQDKKTVRKRRTIGKLDLTKEERRAMIIGAYKAYLPIFLAIIVGFMVFVYGLFLLWVEIVT